MWPILTSLLRGSIADPNNFGTKAWLFFFFFFFFFVNQRLGHCCFVVLIYDATVQLS
jgi:hypothetical protein